jgi:hypothetical protein
MEWNAVFVPRPWSLSNWDVGARVVGGRSGCPFLRLSTGIWLGIEVGNGVYIRSETVVLQLDSMDILTSNTFPDLPSTH